ncbi:MAG: type IX secretion system sortase PorU [Bacteroidales bacterium]|nr:type IX secretion system sortase PorU [Candidatus Sodaliphilus limicaballi]
MSRFFNKHLAVLAVASTIAASTAMALPLRHFATNSKLATGKWVKIAVPATGVYEITNDELQQMGFSDPSKVQVFGMGGNVISEKLDGLYTDDLEPVSVARYNDKLCFYALGPVAMEIADPRSDMPYFKRTINPYSTHGYYFLSEVNSLQTVDEQPSMSRGSVERNTGLGYFYYEQELVSVGLSGKTFLGDNIGSGVCSIDYNMPGLADNTLTVKVGAGINVSAKSYLASSVTANGTQTTIGYPLSTSTIYPPVNSHTYYSPVEPVASVTLPEIVPQGTVNVWVNNPLGTIKTAKLDYVLISYKKENKIPENSNAQTEINIPNLTVQDVISLPGANSSTVVWNVSIASDPVQYELSPAVNEEGETTGYEFTPRISSKAAQYVAFDPSMTLMKISSYEEVGNQNLHSISTPHMLIITSKAFMEQAERVAQLHRDVDGMDVAVVDQEQVFNEFSSGTPDAMAYRLLCKMFYDRDKTKFQNLLLFGQGSYDNRGIVSNKPNRVITYQSTASDNEDDSYVSDDFFGFLDDDSGSSPSHYSDVVRIGVGRYPSASVEEAKTDVDKLIKYVATPDYGPWRNDLLFMGDTGDDDRHIFQAEGISELTQNLGTQLQSNKVYVDMFERSVSDGTTSSEARRRIIEYLNNGQYFATYVGHAGPLNFTKTNMWTSTLAQTTYYPHLPILTTAACEVARYDSDTRGLAEHMFHCPEGGAIAMITTPRQVWDDQNYIMNRGFASNLFSYNTTGKMATLGEVYMKMKSYFGTSYNGNKLCYTLLGDPAIKCNYPKPLFTITSVNGTPVDGSTMVETAPMQAITVTAQVEKADRSGIDTDFNGDATLTLYDTQRLLRNVTYSGVMRSIYYPRDILARVQGRVVNGMFTGTVYVPRHTKALNENAAIKVYAHQDDTDNMVNGDFSSLTIGIFDENEAVADNNAPVIENMFINDEQAFADGCVVPQNSVLYINASDDVALNTMSASVGNTMKLLLDGGKSVFSLVKNSATASNDGRDLSITFPLNSISEGSHTLTFTVFDIAGHSATRTISFIVTNNSDIVLAAQEAPATTVATFDIAEGNFNATPMVNLKITDAHGNIVWNKKTSSFPVSWDLNDNQGNRVKAGLYKFFGNYEDGTNFGGTNIGDLIVIDPVNSNK